MPMRSHGHGHARKPERKRGPGKGQKRKVAPSAARAQQYERDVYRRGDPGEIESLIEDRTQDEPLADEALVGDVTEESLPEDCVPHTMSEVSLRDEDDFDDAGDPGEYSPPEAEDSPAEALPWDQTAIVVIGDQAVFRVPDWAQGFENDDLDLRWDTYARVADWLTRDRKAFLQKPSFLSLAGDPISLIPPISVEREGLHQALRLTCDVTTFSKHAGACCIVWPSRRLPLDELWSQEAKLAWCAQAAVQRQRQRGYVSRSGELGQRDTQPPRDSEEREKLVADAGRGWQLGPSRFVQLLCVLTQCRWREVIDRYARTIFYEE